MGPEVHAFESDFAQFLGVKHAIAVTNGTAALHLSYLALELGPDDEVIQPAINFVAAANASVAVGATPVFADIIGICEPTIDPVDVERLITPHTRAVVVMHYGGYPSRMADICGLCQKHGLAVIEDACHAIGTRYLDPQERFPHGKMAGELGDIAAFSFFSNKNMTSGEGGMVVTNRDDLAKRVRLLRSHGMTTLTWDRYSGHASSYDVMLHGYNYRIDDLRAALGRSQLRKLEHNNNRRKQLVLAFRRHLDGLPGWVVPFEQYLGDGAYHLMVIVAPDEASRSRVVKALKEAAIQTSLHYPCVPDFAVFQLYPAKDVNYSRAFAARAITLPLFPAMNLTQVKEICSVIRDRALEERDEGPHYGS
jgi:dTDP-4-amino-4,6-dideoxygalactose transaminase